MNYLEQSDDQLMESYKNGAIVAFEILVKRYQKQVFLLALKRLQRKDLAEDATQETFLTLHRYVDRYVAEDQFKAFLFHLLMNQCRNVVRGQKREIKAMASLTDERKTEKKENMENDLLDSEDKQALRAAVNALPEKQRDVFFLRFDAGLPLDSIAKQLDVPLGTVKSRLHKGVKLLAELNKVVNNESALGSRA